MLGWWGRGGADSSKEVIEASKSDAPSAETYPLVKTMMVMMIIIIILTL